jgi:hypothetical protein
MMNSKMMASGGAMKSKMMASGGKAPATKKALADHAAKPASKAHAGLKAGGMMKKGYASGGMPMVMKDGKKVPSFAADGKGKMKMGGSVAESKMGKVKTGSGMDGLSRVKTKGAMPKMARASKTY